MRERENDVFAMTYIVVYVYHSLATFLQFTAFQRNEFFVVTAVFLSFVGGAALGSYAAFAV